MNSTQNKVKLHNKHTKNTQLVKIHREFVRFRFCYCSYLVLVENRVMDPNFE